MADSGQDGARHPPRGLAGGEDWLELAARAAGVGVWEIRPEANEMVYSARAKAIWGFAEDEPVTAAMASAAVHPGDRENLAAQSRRALDPDIRERLPYEYRVLHPEKGVRWVRAYGEAVFEDGPGGPRAVRYVGTMEDISEQKRVERELRASEGRLRLALAAGRMAVCEVDIATGEFTANSELNRMFGFAAGETPSLAEVNARYLPGEPERVQAIAEAALRRGERHFEAEVRCRWPSQEVRWLLLRAEVLFRRDATPRSLVGVLMDITDRKGGEERLKLLAREVDHRANNLLTVVQSTVALSQAATVEALKEVLAGRVAALATAHQLLSEGRWQGADLERLVREELGPYASGDGRRAHVDGPVLALPPQTAQSLAMAIHELATNAAKYGALSVADGKVAVTWAVPDASGVIAIRWRERGGPPVTPPPRRGLGMAVLERAFVGLPGGETRLDWDPLGLVCELRLTIDGPVAADP